MESVSFNGLQANGFSLAGTGLIYDLNHVLDIPSRPPLDLVFTPAPSSAPSELQYTVGKAIGLDPELSLFNQAVNVYPQLRSIVSDQGLTMTLFAPKNTGFLGLGQDTFNLYLSPPFSVHLADIIGYHIVPLRILEESDFVDGTTIRTIQLDREDVLVDVAANGDVYLRTTAARDPTLATGADPVITDFNIDTVNGIIHKFDGVFLPSWAYMDVMDSLNRFPESYSTLLELIVGSANEDRFRQMREFTLIAPNNNAFQQFGITTEVFLAPENVPDTTQLINYHVLPRVFTAEVGEIWQNVETLAVGYNVTIEIKSSINFNDVPSSAFRLFQSGIVHEVGRVLIPQGP